MEGVMESVIESDMKDRSRGRSANPLARHADASNAM
jgi:hypothetical protein